MTVNIGELDELRDALAEAGRQGDRDRATIDGLRDEVRSWQREAQHQVRNILSVVRSITRRTVAEGETPEDHRARLDSRLDSFTRLQSHILNNPVQGVDLWLMVADELLAFGFGIGAGVNLEGATVCLKPKPATVLGLAFHELARMAIEGGVSAELNTAIVVRWQSESSEGEPQHLRIDWIETGRQVGSSLNPDPTFGRDVLEQAVAYELGGSVHLDVTEDGLRCCFLVPMNCLVSFGPA